VILPIRAGGASARMGGFGTRLERALSSLSTRSTLACVLVARSSCKPSSPPRARRRVGSPRSYFRCLPSSLQLIALPLLRGSSRGDADYVPPTGLDSARVCSQQAFPLKHAGPSSLVATPTRSAFLRLSPAGSLQPFLSPVSIPPESLSSPDEVPSTNWLPACSASLLRRRCHRARPTAGQLALMHYRAPKAHQSTGGRMGKKRELISRRGNCACDRLTVIYSRSRRPSQPLIENNRSRLGP